MRTIVIPCIPSKKLIEFAVKHGFHIVSVLDFVDEATFAQQNAQREILEYKPMKIEIPESFDLPFGYGESPSKEQRAQWRRNDKHRFKR